MTEERLLLKMILQRSLVLSQTTLQSTLFHTQIFALRKKVSLLIKAMLYRAEAVLYQSLLLQDLEEQIEVLTKLKSFILRDNREGGYL